MPGIQWHPSGPTRAAAIRPIWPACFCKGTTPGSWPSRDPHSVWAGGAEPYRLRPEPLDLLIPWRFRLLPGCRCRLRTLTGRPAPDGEAARSCRRGHGQTTGQPHLGTHCSPCHPPAGAKGGGVDFTELETHLWEGALAAWNFPVLSPGCETASAPGRVSRRPGGHPSGLVSKRLRGRALTDRAHGRLLKAV